MITRSITALVPWLAHAAGFAGEQPSAFSPPRASTARRHADAPATLLHSQSVNDDVSGFHYDQEPRGTSFMSQMSKQDLWERRQVRRGMARQQRRAPNSRGAFPPRPQYGPINGAGSPMPMGAAPGSYGPINGGGFPMGAAPGSEFDAFKQSVSASLKSMTDLLREMQESQTAQSTDVLALSSKVANMSARLGEAEVKNRVVTENAPVDIENKNFGTSLDGAFHQKIKDVVDQFSIVDRDGDGSSEVVSKSGGEQFYGTKIAQLEAKINRIDDALKATEEKLDSQMEFVDRLVGGGVADDGPGFDGPFQQQPPPSEQFMPDGMPPPPFEEFPQPPPPPPRADEGPDPFMDDGRSYYQERNYNDPNNIPPPPPRQEISSSQKQTTKSVNTRSNSHHYTEPNTSFVSAWSKADNELRKEFRPFDREVRRNAIGQGEQVLPRGAPRAANRQYAIPPPPPPEPMGMGGYYEEPYMYGEGPMMMDEEMFYDGGMYEF